MTAPLIQFRVGDRQTGKTTQSVLQLSRNPAAVMVGLHSNHVRDLRREFTVVKDRIFTAEEWASGRSRGRVAGEVILEDFDAIIWEHIYRGHSGPAPSVTVTATGKVL